MFSNFLVSTYCLSQKKPITGLTLKYVKNVLAITIGITFVMPYHGLIAKDVLSLLLTENSKYFVVILNSKYYGSRITTKNIRHF